jgi:3-hydroxybutyryl-CoA dehydrogenase
MAERIAIIGGGLMGHGIALVFASAGHPVRVTDPVAEARALILTRIETTLGELGRDRKAIENIEVEDTLKKCVSGADVVIEAAPENLELKQQIFAEVEQAASGAILASNTSVIPIGQIMSRVKDRTRALGTHWWNPPYLVPLVEVVRTP